MIIHIVQCDSADNNDQISYYDLDVSKKDRLTTIKSRILHEKQNVVVEVKFNGRILDDAMTLEDGDIQNGSTLYIKTARTSRGGGAVSAKIVLKTDNGDILTERKLLPTTTVEDLKRSLVDQIETSPEQIKFVLNGEVIKDEAIVCDLRIRRREMMYYCLNLEPTYNSKGIKTGYTLKPARN